MYTEYEKLCVVRCLGAAAFYSYGGSEPPPYGSFFFYTINIASPKEKKRYFSCTALL